MTTGPAAIQVRPLSSCWRRCAPNPNPNPSPTPTPTPNPSPTPSLSSPDPEPNQVRADWFDRWAGGKIKNRGAEYAQAKQAWKELH
jgi:hypothetical protein